MPKSDAKPYSNLSVRTQTNKYLPKPIKYLTIG